MLLVNLLAWPEGANARGKVFEIDAAVILGPTGVLLLVAALGIVRRWRRRWWPNAMPAPAFGLILASWMSNWSLDWIATSLIFVALLAIWHLR